MINESGGRTAGTRTQGFRSGVALWPAVVVALAFAVRTVDALRRPFHTDERISLLWSTFGVKYLLDWLRTWDVHPPLYFLLLHYLRLAQAPDWVPRMLMVAIGTVSVALLYALVRMWAGERAAVVAALCAAFMPILVFYDTWVRMYALSNVFVLAEFVLLSALLLAPNLSARARAALWICWALVVAGAGYTLYVAWFAAVAQWLYIACLHRSRLAPATLAFAGAALVWLPQFPTVLHQMGMGGATFQGYHGHQLAGLFALPGQATIVPELEGAAAAVGAALAWVWLAATLWIAAASSPRSMLPWLGVPAVLTFAFGLATHKLIYLDRYYIELAYAGAAWTGCAAGVAWKQKNASWRIAAGTVLASIVVLGSAYAIIPSFYTADWPGVARALAAGVQPGDLIIMEQGMPQWSMAGNPDIAAHPHVFLFWANQIPGAVSAAQRYRRIWVMAYEPRGIDPNLVLLHALGQHYHVAAAYTFNRFLPAENVVLILFTR
jgi:hypothetical protein